VQHAVNDETISFLVADFDESLNEYLLRFSVGDSTHEAWFSDAFIAECFGPITPPRFLVA